MSVGDARVTRNGCDAAVSSGAPRMATSARGSARARGRLPTCPWVARTSRSSRSGAMLSTAVRAGAFSRIRRVIAEPQGGGSSNSETLNRLAVTIDGGSVVLCRVPLGCGNACKRPTIVMTFHLVLGQSQRIVYLFPPTEPISKVRHTTPISERPTKRNVKSGCRRPMRSTDRIRPARSHPGAESWR
jgi:hypothetical protein